MNEIKSDRTTDRTRKKRPRRLPPLKALWTWALIHVALTLSWLLPPPRAEVRATAAAISAAISTGTGLPQAELDARAPLTPQEEARFSTGAHERTLRSVYQATGLATQGGPADGTIRRIARLIGRCEKTVQRCHRELEARGLLRIRQRKIERLWFGPRGQRYRFYNEPNDYRFLLRQRQLQIFFKNVPLSRKNLKTYKATTPQRLPGMWKCKRRTRPDDHPAEFRAAWERRRRANHPPELRERYEAQGEAWEALRQWRRGGGREAGILNQAAAARVGTGYASEAARIYDFFDGAERMGLGRRRREELEERELKAAARDAATAISWAELDQAELAAEYVAKLSPPVLTQAELDQAELAREAREAAELEAWSADQAAAIQHRADLAAAISAAEPDKKKFLPAEIFDKENLSAELAGAGVCDLCDGKRRRVVRGIIVVCKCVR